MTKAEKLVRYIFALLSLTVLLGGGCLLGIHLGTGLNKSDPNADLGVEKIQQEEQGVATTQAITSTSQTLVQNNANVRLYVFYDTSLVSSVSINLRFQKGSMVSYFVLGTATNNFVAGTTLTITPGPGAVWKTSKVTFNIYGDIGNKSNSNYNNPTSYTSWKKVALSTTAEQTRDGNNLTGKNINLMSAMQGINKYSTFVIDLTEYDLFSRTSVAKPVATGGTSYTYTGSEITHQVNNYNTNYMTRSGTASATNAGNYTVKYTLKSGYCWSDNTTSVVSLSWKITQATNSWTSQPSIPNWTYGSAPSTINVGTPKFGTNYYYWGVVNADIFETYYIVDGMGFAGFDLSENAWQLDAYITSDRESYPLFCVFDSGYSGNISGGMNVLEEDVVYWSDIPSGRYYFYAFMPATSVNYTTDNITYAKEFYVYAPAPTVTNLTFTYNGNNQGPTVTGNTDYYDIDGTTTAKNVGRYSFFIYAKTGVDTYSDRAYPYYFENRGTMADYVNELGYDSLAEAYADEGASNITAEAITYMLGQLLYNINYGIAKASVTKPTLTTTHVTYNRAAQGPGNVTAAQTNITKRTGTTSATNAGTYYIYYELLDTTNYQWAGGGNGKLTRTWYIDKANISGATVTIPQTDYTYDGSAKTPDPTVTV